MPRQKQFKEQEVLQKAILLFWKNGFHATSMQDLVDGLGINRASMYDTFGSKEGLFNKALLAYKSQLKEQLISFFRQQPNVKQGLYNLFEFVVNESVNDPDGKGCFLANTTTELLPSDAATKAIVAEHQQETESLFREFLEWGVSNGEISNSKNLSAIAALFFCNTTDSK